MWVIHDCTNHELVFFDDKESAERFWSKTPMALCEREATPAEIEEFRAGEWKHG